MVRLAGFNVIAHHHAKDGFLLQEVTLDKDKLKKILDDHKKHLNGDAGGVKANLEGANLRGVDLEGANLSWANLQGANLEGVNLRRANLEGANLSWANLRGVDLEGANLSGAYLRAAELEGANLQGANLTLTGIVTLGGVMHFAFCHEELIKIGCISMSILEWVDQFDSMGNVHGYDDVQIEIYGQFIVSCLELRSTQY